MKYDVTVRVWANVEMEVEAKTERAAKLIGENYWSDENVDYQVEEVEVIEKYKYLENIKKQRGFPLFTHKVKYINNHTEVYHAWRYYMRNDKIKEEIIQLELSINNLSCEKMEQLIKLQIACLKG